jgi:hypothetical protein
VIYQDGQGANDRLTSLITGFYAALLSDRAIKFTFYLGKFFIHSPLTIMIDMLADTPPFQLAFDTPYLNVTSDDKFHRLIAEKVQENKKVKDKDFVVMGYRDSYPLFHPQSKIDEFNIPALLGPSKHIIFNSNRGYTFHLLNSSTHGEKLRTLYNINPFYGFYCAFHFLFRPNDKVVEYAKPYIATIKDKNIIKIGIQIRAGDEHIGNGDQLKLSSDYYYQNFFSCAEIIERDVIKHSNPTGKEVKWFLISDSLSLKKDAKRIYGDKLLTDTVNEPAHTGM